MSDLQFERAVSDWLDDGSDRTPPRAIDGVLLAVKTTPQERDLRISWRTSPMPVLSRSLGLVAVVLVAAVATGGLLSLTSEPGASGDSMPPTRGPSSGTSNTPEPATAEPTLAFATPFSSPAFGYDARFPVDWTSATGSTPGTAEQLALGESEFAAPLHWDHFNPGRNTPLGPTIIATSTVLPPGTTEDEWVVAYQAPQVAQAGRECIPDRSTWEPIEIDGVVGGTYVGCVFVEAMVFEAGRVYVFAYLNGSSSHEAVRASGPPILRAFLDTVSLHPERAATSTPAPS